MFYCNECAIKMGVGLSLFKADGPCDVCLKDVPCNSSKPKSNKRDVFDCTTGQVNPKEVA